MNSCGKKDMIITDLHVKISVTQNNTMLSKYIFGSTKKKNAKKPEVKWSILKGANARIKGLKQYKLCQEEKIILVFNWNHFEMRLLNLRINFYLLRTFCPHLGSFFFLCCFFFHYVSAKFHHWPSLGDLLRPRIGMLSLITVSPVITAFHSCCLSHHVFTLVKNVVR